MSGFEIVYETVVVIIPTSRDGESFHLSNIKQWVKENDFRLMTNRINLNLLIVDDSVSDAIKNITKGTCFFRYLRGSNGYADSIMKAILRSGGGDKFIVMDVDHPIKYIETMIEMLNEFDMVIGHELVENKERQVTNWICRNFLGIDYPHPTCGFMAFNSDVLGFKITERTIPFHRAKSKYDVMHLEWLYMGIKKNLNIGVMSFKPHVVSHEYGIRRSLKWLYDIFKLKFYDITLNWYGSD